MFKDKSAERLEAALGNLPPAYSSNVKEIRVSWKENPDVRCSSMWPEITIVFKETLEEELNATERILCTKGDSIF